MNRRIVNNSLRPKLTIKDVTHANIFDKYSEFSYVDIMQNCWKQKLEDRISLDELITMINTCLDEKPSKKAIEETPIEIDNNDSNDCNSNE